MATFLPAHPRRAKTRLVPGKAAARSTARRIMGAMSVDASEMVSRQSLRGESYILTRPPEPAKDRFCSHGRR